MPLSIPLSSDRAYLLVSYQAAKAATNNYRDIRHKATLHLPRGAACGLVSGVQVVSSITRRLQVIAEQLLGC